MADGSQQLPPVDLEALGLKRELGACPAFEISRSLDVGDLALLATTEPTQVRPTIAHIRQSHHAVARLLARGETEVTVSAITGYSINRIYTLQQDPAFQQLLSTYQGMEQEAIDSATAQMSERLAAIGFDSLEVLHERLLDNPDSLSTKDLLTAIEIVADRTGHGKTSTVNTNATFGLDAATLERIRLSRDAPAAVSEEDRQSLLRLAVRATDEHSEGETPARGGGEGNSLREEIVEGTFEEVPRSTPPQLDTIP